ncbi:MAG: autotransporter outer membrane beta-barrel domain-containing protein, partial [Mailhella sp.]|nr:autotransporter outer membrane beta-barrel domain-containing protein [Mailhella sp.]
ASVQYSERGNYEDSFDANTGTASITKTTSAVEGASLKQETDGFYDEATGTVSAEGTAIVDKAPEAPAPEVTTPENAAPTNHNLNGIAEMSAVGLHIWRNEINDMNKRLGDLRASKGSKHGLWTRVYNGKARFGSLDVTNKYTAVQLGYDQQIMPGFWLGGAFSYTGGDSDFAKGDGSSDILAFTAYGSYLAENGLFVDVTAKYGFLSNEFDIALPGGIRSKGDYNTNALSFSGELGWHLTPFRCGFFLEPQLEVMYGVVESASYTTSTGIGVKQDSAHALIGRAGLMLGWKFDDFGSAYVCASALRDFKGEADYSFHRDGVTRRLSEDLGDSWYEFGVGANCKITDNIHTYVDLETSHGGEVETDYRVNVGLRYTF